MKKLQVIKAATGKFDRGGKKGFTRFGQRRWVRCDRAIACIPSSEVGDRLINF